MLGKPLSVYVLASLEALQTKVSVSKSGLVCLSMYGWGQDAHSWLLGPDLCFQKPVVTDGAAAWNCSVPSALQLLTHFIEVCFKQA